MAQEKQMNNTCPDCEQVMSWCLGQYHCAPCAKTFDKIFYCYDCQTQLEKLQACGAVNVFCPQCNELKSKRLSKVDWQERVDL